MTSSTRPLEVLARTDIDTDVFRGQPSLYCEAFGEDAEDDIALYRRSVRQRFPPSVAYRAQASRLGSPAAAADSPIGESERLRLIGQTRNIERYPGETDEQYCERIAGAFPAWNAGGTESAIVSQIQAFGVADAEVWEEFEYYLTLASDYGDRFVVVLGPDYGSVGWTGCTLGGVILGETLLGIGPADPLQVSALPRIVLKWKHAWSFPVRILCLFGDVAPLGIAVLGAVTLGDGTGGIASIEMGSVRMLGNTVLGEHIGVGFNL